MTDRIKFQFAARPKQAQDDNTPQNLQDAPEISGEAVQEDAERTPFENKMLTMPSTNAGRRH